MAAKALFSSFKLPASESPWAVLYVVFGLLAFAIQDAVVKQLSVDYPVLQLLTVRGVVVFVSLGVLVFVVGGLPLFKSTRPSPMLLRGVFAFFAFTIYYLALSKIPFADGAAVYMTAPLFVTALSIPLLGERVGIHRVLAVLTGFLAALVMINPGSTLFQPAAVLPLFSAMLYAFIPIINRHIGLSQHPLTMGFYTTASYLGLCILAGLIVHSFEWSISEGSLFSNLFQPWLPMTTPALLLTALSGFFFVLGLLGLTQSYRLLPVSIVAPFEYSYLLWATLIGLIAFNEIPGPRTLLGGLVIILCGCYVAFREHQVTSDSA